MRNSADASRRTNGKEICLIQAFTTSAVWTKGQVMNQYFRYFGIMDKLKVRRLDDTAFDTIYYKGKSYDYAMDTAVIETL